MSQENKQTVATDLASIPDDAAQQAAAKAAKPQQKKAKPQAKAQPVAQAQQAQAQPQAAVAAPPAPPAQQTPLTLEALEKRVSALEGGLSEVREAQGKQGEQLDAIWAHQESTKLDIISAMNTMMERHERYSGVFGIVRKAWDKITLPHRIAKHNDEAIDAALRGENPTLNAEAAAKAAADREALAKAVAEVKARQEKAKKQVEKDTVITPA